MIQKLKPIICFAAVLLLSTQVLWAQPAPPAFTPTDPEFVGVDPASAMGEATNFRFLTDVDSFFHVNYWQDLEAAKWFSYLKMQDIKTGSPWEMGLALGLENAYVGLYYHGQFNDGVEQLGTLNHDNRTWTGGISGDISRRNYFGLLLGKGDHGLKFSINQSLVTYDFEGYHDTEFIHYRGQHGSVTPAFQWGSAKDLEIGKRTWRPSAGLALEVNFNNRTTVSITDKDGNTDYDDATANANSSMRPIITFDTGYISLWDGDWGTMTFGVSEEFSLTIEGEGTESAVEWDNILTPYLAFNYTVTEYFALGTKLTVPILCGWNPANDIYFGVGAKNNTDKENLPALATGFQLKGSILNNWVGKYLLPLDKLSVNWGVKANLPGYFTTSNYDNDTRIDSARRRGWVTGDNDNFLQMVTFGFTYELAPNAIFDCTFGNNSFKLLFSIRHDGSRSSKKADSGSSSSGTAERMEIPEIQAWDDAE
ncbi:MAG: hypothetical protein FWD36_02015 [Treponema sp.]|nr:hypothetical protein [Treponema sp.]